ncbi:APC family permease [Candidatus Protochlamydia phocaeensis]|uniref:APC family permease n=1 Tax=Candidatus Protochlamydia phocaeensis TaxID=1414722 RepID=UPI00083871D2|nr:APC family permease [Candidatus Protochlamydia phocaeensis]
MKSNDSKKMGLISIILLGINGIIGSGIFLLPGKVSSLVGSASLFVYGFVTLLVLAIAWCFAQCSALFNRSGGAYIYAKEAFGEFIGFEIGLMRWIIGVTAWASLIVGFITALSSIWPDVLQEPVRSLLILGIAGSLGILNIIGGVRILKYLNNMITVAKLLPLVFFVVVGVFYMDQANFASLSSLEWETGAFGASALVIFYAFGGFETLVVAAGEMKNPKKNLPIAVMVVIGFCSLLYILVQMISIGILGSALDDNPTPIAHAANEIVGSTGQWIVMSAMLVSIGGVNISASFITPRSGVALAEDGMIPRWIAYKGGFDTPIWAILLTLGMTAVIALSGSFTQLVTISVVSRFAQYASTCLAVIVFYKRGWLPSSSVKKVLYIAIPLVALTGIFWLLLHATAFQIVWGLGALFFGVPLYFLRTKFNPSEVAQSVVSL